MAGENKPPRRKPPVDNETAVLVKSARRCPLCFHLHGDLAQKHGQIAHLNDDRTDGSEDNLAFMCMPHHSEYDSTTSQHKNFTIPELKELRSRLYDAVARREHFGTADYKSSATAAAQRAARAWVIVQSVECSPDLNAEHIILRALTTLVNRGQTPALDLRTWQKIEVRASPPSSRDYPQPLNDGSMGALAPNECGQTPAILEPSLPEFVEINARRLTAFVYGVAEYKDVVFEQLNRTSWCLEYVPESKQFRYSEEGNAVS